MSGTPVPKPPLTAAACLGASPLFRSFPPAAIARVAETTQWIQAHKCQTLFEEGEQGIDVFLIATGRVSVQIESISPMMEIGINRLDAGEVVGEMALLGPSTRSATVVCVAPSWVLRVPIKPLRDAMLGDSALEAMLMRNLAAILADRLRTMNLRVMGMMRARAYAEAHEH